MKNKLLVLLIGSYVLAFSINLMPAIKYPDLDVNFLNLLATAVFLALLLLNARNDSTKLRIFLSIGILSGVLVYFISLFESPMLEHGLLDAIASIQYPFFLIFTTPLFGGNLLLDIGYGPYSLLMSLLYAAVLVLATYSKKNPVQIV